MFFEKKNKLEYENASVANTFFANGSLTEMGYYLTYDGYPKNFIVSGGIYSEDRIEAIRMYLEQYLGNIPVIILHQADCYMERLVEQVWSELPLERKSTGPFWKTDAWNAHFEPFYGMNDMQIISCCREIARKLNYTLTPRFEKVVRAHLRILNLLQIPASLSGLYYLCQFQNMQEFHNNILALPCGEVAAMQLWADLGVNGDDENNQFDLFRTVIYNLANESQQNGWNSNNEVSCVNCMETIRQNGTLIASLNDMYTDVFLNYLVEELRCNTHTPFILLIDQVHIKDERFLKYLQSAPSNCFIGIFSENIVDTMDGKAENVFHISQKMRTLLVFKQSTAKSAAVISEIIGKYDYLKAQTSQGANRKAFSLFPGQENNSVSYSTENRYRVMPEDLTGLQTGQAVVFDTTTDEIIYYN